MSTFGFESTTDDVLKGHDLAGQVAVVTGASSGLGLETARALVAHGAHVVLAGRNQQRVDAAMSTIHEQHPGGSMEPLLLDLSDIAACRTAAAQLRSSVDRIDVLINNAGVMCTPLGRTTDGFETQVGTNHLGHMAWTMPLIQILQATADTHGGSRIVNLSSAGHRFGDVVLDDINYEQRSYDPWQAYGQSKTANILFSVELERRFGPNGIRSVAVHPGGIHTNLGRHMTAEIRNDLKKQIAISDPGGFAWKTIEQGAATTVWAAIAPEFNSAGGVYCEDCSVAPIDDVASQTGRGVLSYAVDAARAAALWDVSEALLDAV